MYILLRGKELREREREREREIIIIIICLFAVTSGYKIIHINTNNIRKVIT